MKLIINENLLKLAFVPFILTVIMVVGVIILTIIFINIELRKKDRK